MSGAGAGPSSRCGAERQPPPPGAGRRSPAAVGACGHTAGGAAASRGGAAGASPAGRPLARRHRGGGGGRALSAGAAPLRGESPSSDTRVNFLPPPRAHAGGSQWVGAGIRGPGRGMRLRRHWAPSRGGGRERNRPAVRRGAGCPVPVRGA